MAESLKPVRSEASPAAKQLLGESKPFTLGWWKEIAYLHLGTLLMSVGVYFFKFPNHFTTGGVSGISILVSKYLPEISTATMNLILNAALLLIGLMFLGKKFSVRTAYCSMLFSFLTLAMEKLWPMDAPMTTQPLLELMFAVGLPAVGSAILFNVNASSGGTDIIAMLVKKFSHVHIGLALALADLLVAIGACFAFGMETGLFSLFGLFVKSVLVDEVMDSLHTYKVFQIITENPDPICRFIMENLHHGATVTEGEGTYTHQKRKIIMTVINRSQAIRLQMFVRATDPHSFITITSSSEIVGKGFRGMTE